MTPTQKPPTPEELRAARAALRDSTREMRMNRDAHWRVWRSRFRLWRAGRRYFRYFERLDRGRHRLDGGAPVSGRGVTVRGDRRPVSLLAEEKTA